MSYKFETILSPNYTPGSQARAFYGRPRTIEFGAGHWWGDPHAGYSHQGVINTFMNPARQASSHYVVSAGRVTQMVRDGDVSWATNNANPYTISIEVDPRMHLGGPTAEAIMKTLTEFIAAKGWHDLIWRPHKYWWSTACNPLNWTEIMRRSKLERNELVKPKPPAVRETARENFSPARKMIFTKDTTLAKIPAGTSADSKVFKKGESIDIAQLLTMSNGTKWWRTAYSAKNETATGFASHILEEAPKPAPEWQRNLVDSVDIDLFVLPAEGATIVDLNTLKVVGTKIPKGTAVSIAKTTTVGGKKYLLSSYAVKNSMPHGILADSLGVPAAPPVQTKPAWLLKWRDIVDVTMFTRVETEVVNLLDGSTVTTIPINTPVKIASATEWHGKEYLISEYSTGRMEPRGIPLVNLDMDPIKEPESPIEPDPVQPDLERRVSALEALIKKIVAFLAEKLGFKQ